MPNIKPERFALGRIVMTHGVRKLANSPEELANLLIRHGRGDWGDLCEEDKQTNDMALLTAYNRLFSAYDYNGTKIWIITDRPESGGNITTALLPSEY